MTTTLYSPSAPTGDRDRRESRASQDRRGRGEHGGHAARRATSMPRVPSPGIVTQNGLPSLASGSNKSRGTDPIRKWRHVLSESRKMWSGDFSARTER